MHTRAHTHTQPGVERAKECLYRPFRAGARTPPLSLSFSLSPSTSLQPRTQETIKTGVVRAKESVRAMFRTGAPKQTSAKHRDDEDD